MPFSIGGMVDDLLPEVWISLGKVAKSTFFKNMEKIVSNIFPNVIFGTSGFGNSNLQILEFQIPNTLHEELKGQLIDENQNDNKIYLEVRAYNWSPIHPPTYETYVNTINEIFKPLIKKYNETNKSQFKIYIQKKESLEEQLPPTIQLLFNNFVNGVNKSILHPLDWKLFYSFIRACHYHHKKIYIERLLVFAGFSEEYASKLQEVFDHCYEVLNVPIPLLATSLSGYYMDKIYNEVKNKKPCFNKIDLLDVKVKQNKKNEVILTLKGWAKNVETKEEFLKDLEQILNTTTQAVKIEDNMEIS